MADQVLLLVYENSGTVSRRQDPGRFAEQLLNDGLILLRRHGMPSGLRNLPGRRGQ